MSAFSEGELAYLLGERRLGRVATVGKDGTPHARSTWRSFSSITIPTRASSEHGRSAHTVARGR